MKSSPPCPAALENKKQRNMNIERLALFLLWSLALTSIFTFFILYSLNPFNLTTHHLKQQDFNGKAILIKPSKDYEKCDLFNGGWVPDRNGSLYTNWSCPLMAKWRNCGMHGREDVEFVNWRWKPHGCELSRFAPKNFLQIVRGKTLAFIGDSIARNHMESLLCLLSQEQTPINTYKDAEDRFRTWYFPSHNFTLTVFWSKFLVIGSKRITNSSNSAVFEMHLDKVDEKWASKLPDVDYAIISSAHWFPRQNYLYKNGKLIGCVYCDEHNVTNQSPGFALRGAFRTALRYINDCKVCKDRGLVTILRTYSPSHFQNGDWNTGGNCNKTSPLSESEINFGGFEEEFRRIQMEEINRVKKEGKESGMRFETLDVTRPMLMRPDGHPDIHWDNRWVHGYSDCLHWCLPGPIDAWNDILMAILSKEDV